MSKLPTYEELAKMVSELTELNIANLEQPAHRFVSCFTYSTGQIPDHWWRAIQMREALLKENVVTLRKHPRTPLLRDRKGKELP
jgi:hypothetical protein